MTAMWVGLFVSGVVAAVIVVGSRRHRAGMTELGTVSEHWIAEQRANDRHYSER
jgi:hypothetical protein